MPSTEPRSTDAPTAGAADLTPTSDTPRAVTAPETLPPNAVRQREGATTDATRLHVTADAAVKQNTFPSRAGYPKGMTNLQTHLHVEAWVKNTTFAKTLWIDVHVFEAHYEPVHTETLPLRYARPAGDGGDVFVFDGTLYQGLVATQGSVTPRPDARRVQYRLYCELDGTVYTDGVLHECTLRPDSASH